MIVYPYSSPIILNDNVFTEYGGIIGESNNAQRQAAYLIAEQQMVSHIGTLLLPEDITTTAPYNVKMKYFVTDYGYVNRLYGARVVNPWGETKWDISGTGNYMTVSDDTYGYLYVVDWMTRCQCYEEPLTIEFSYNAGLPTGVASQPGMLLALTMAAQINLNEFAVVSANEGVGNVGIEEFSSLEYREKRKPWKNTSFGASAKSARVAQLVDSTIRKARRAVVLGRTY
jgi:hypothetical protein